MKLNKTAIGLASGIVWGGSIFLLTFFIMINMSLRGGTGEILSKLGRIYIGYTVSLTGALIGLIYGFIHAYIIGWIWASLYNLFSQEEAASQTTSTE